MSYRELIDSLRKEGEESVQRVWSEVEAEAENNRAEAARTRETMERHYREVKEKGVREQERELLSRSSENARKIILEAESTFSDRLFTTARELLSTLRNERYEEVFSSLVKELPDTGWDEVRVHPRDLQRAKKYFPNANILPHDSIRGGIEVLKKGGKILVVNTFEKRLIRAWDELLPMILRDVYREISNNETSPEA
jgi:vacuolar-type H+-ATPase subunit E/Vma4